MKHIITALALVASTTASAQFINGNDLFNHMNDSSAIKKMLALGYIAGVSDASQGEYHCTPASVSLGQTNDVVLKYLTKDPANRHLDASILVTVALVEVWPCPKKKGGSL
jgi:hypothetical protein